MLTEKEKSLITLLRSLKKENQERSDYWYIE